MNIRMLVAVSVLAGSLWLTTDAARAQEDIASPVLLGLGGAYAAVPNVPDVVWFNPAVTAFAGTQAAVSLSYRRLFELPEMEEVVGSVTGRVHDRIAIGGGLSYFGEPGLYEELQGNASIAIMIRSRLALALATTLQRNVFGESAIAYSGAQLSFGTAWKPLDNVLAAIAIRQLSISDLYVNGDRESAIDVSLAWSLPPDLTIAGRWFNEKDQNDRFGLGQILRLTEQLHLLTGLRFDPIQYSLGGQIAHRGLQLHYVYVGHPELGGTHTVGAAWMIE